MSECPEVGKLLTQLTFDVDMESEGMGYILEDGMPPKEAARTLIAAYPDRLQGWLDGVETVDGAPALAAVKSDLGL